MSKYAGFNTVELRRPQRSQFDLSHQKRLTTRAGRLTPVFISEAVPGDTFNGSCEILVRLAPLLAPIYDMLMLYVHIFFVPCRLLYLDWEEFITGGRLGVGIDPVNAPLPPYFSIGVKGVSSEPDGAFFARSSLSDYLGVPIFAELPGFVDWASYNSCEMDFMPYMAYQKVWFDYYRDRNFVSDDVLVTNMPVASGIKGGTTMNQYFELRDRCWEHDYFTSALPNTQRGVEVLMPLTGSGTVTYLDQSLVRNSDGSTPADGPTGVNLGFLRSDYGGPGEDAARIENIDEVLIENSATSINDFRTAYALQVWLERNEIAGSRYNESTLAHFGVRPQDDRLQRAEYLGGGRIPIKISEIVSTAYSDDGDAIVPLANLAGHGITYGNTNQFRYFCPEHGFIIGIASIMSPPSYHQGIPRMFARRSFLDYPWPTFAKLGEQEVERAEVFASAANMTRNAEGVRPLFAYQSRYADWKNINSTNHGEFHNSMLFWSLTRDFAGSPVLGNAFVLYDTTITDRIFAVESGDNFWLYVHNHVTVVRCLPYYGTPNTLGFS